MGDNYAIIHYFPVIYMYWYFPVFPTVPVISLLFDNPEFHLIVHLFGPV